MDAGPGLNFFSLHKERLLFSALGPLAIPEFVATEIDRKSKEQRFAAARNVMAKVPDTLLEILSDEVTDELAAAVQRVGGVPMTERMRSPKNLGETMVVAHAAIAAKRGDHVLVLIDDGDGRRIAAAEAERLRQRRVAGLGNGGISLVDTVAVLRKAAGSDYVPDRHSMRELYKRLRQLDDGLMPLDRTGLMDLDCWNRR